MPDRPLYSSQTELQLLAGLLRDPLQRGALAEQTAVDLQHRQAICEEELEVFHVNKLI